MCDICDGVSAGMTSKEIEIALNKISKEIAKGRNPEHFNKALDVLLSTEMEDRDDDVESAWEDDYRGTD